MPGASRLSGWCGRAGISAKVAAGGLVLAVLVIRIVEAYSQRATLPNGMIVARQPGFLSRSDDVLLSADGRTVLARAIEFVCFNDRYVLVWSLQAEFYGLFDALADPPLQRLSYADAMAESGLAGEGGCGGHYRGMVGSSLLYDGNTAPFLPPCDWRNFRAKGLKHREWFDRPCES